MPIEANLIIEKPTEATKEFLGRCAFFNCLKDKNTINLDITKLFLLKSLYGNEFKDALPFQKLFSTYSPTKTIVIPEDSKYNGIMGDLNVDFIKFIKECSISTKTTIRISYLHERGDWPYEIATWKFFATGKVEESLSIECFDDHDGEEANTYFEIYRNENYKPSKSQ